MTKRLYLDDSYLTTCEANVLGCAREDDGYVVLLDQTVLYPEGGGQPCDRGRIGGTNVLAVTERDETVRHVVDAPLQVGQRVLVEVDWPRRFEYMQQHCGEHLLSYAAKELFGAGNVGFHMADAYCTADLNMPLEQEQIDLLELRTNELVCSNLPIEIRYVDAEELAGMQLRKKAAGLEGEIRIISMPGADSCTCCGTHPRFTGEIGFVKVVGAEHHKGGERLTFVCGRRASLAMQYTQRTLERLSRSFSCKAEDVHTAIMKQQQELNAMKRENKALYTRLLAYLREELQQKAKVVKGRRVVVHMLELPGAQLRPLALAICEGAAREGAAREGAAREGAAREGALALLLSRNADAVQYVLCCSEGMPFDMGELAEAVNAALGGRGGGRGTLAQGSAPYGKGIAETLMQLEGYFMQRLQAMKG